MICWTELKNDDVVGGGGLAVHHRGFEYPLSGSSERCGSEWCISSLSVTCWMSADDVTRGIDAELKCNINRLVERNPPQKAYFGINLVNRFAAVYITNLWLSATCR